MSSECLFCRIVAGSIPAKRLFEDEVCLAFADVNPQAPAHLLVIPKAHHASLEGVGAELLGHLLAAVPRIALEQGLAKGYRVVVNTGPDGGQTVEHLHLHVLGGRQMGWPPG